jgi:hypothetical protein
MGFNQDGFLSEDIDKWRLEKRVKYPEHFKLVTDINRTAQGMLPLIGNFPPHVDALLVCGFYVRAVQYQGSILMAERGLITEATTLMRSTIETLFYRVDVGLREAGHLKPHECHVIDERQVAGDEFGERRKSLPITSPRLRMVLGLVAALLHECGQQVRR